jgi:uncharacterized RDD family membrane protein YckC
MFSDTKIQQLYKRKIMVQTRQNPQNNSMQQNPEPNIPKASTSIRLSNYVIDMIICRVIGTGVGFITGIFLAASGNVEAIDSSSFNFIAFLAGYTIFFSYYFISEAFLGGTIGKLVTGTCVLTTDGKKPDTKTFALRSLIRLVPFEPISCASGDGWHDRWSKTIVVLRKH